MAIAKNHCLLVLGLLTLLSTLHAQQIILTEPPPSFQCLDITSISICSQINYTMGSFPNWRDQTRLSEADTELNNYLPVIRTGCSQTIVHLLCTIYAPFCQPDLPHIRLPPCKEICLDARRGCEPVFQRFNHQWPPALDCDRYPSREETRLSFCYTDDISEIVIPSNIMIDPTSAPPVTGSTPPSSTVVTGPTVQPLTCPIEQRVFGNLVNTSYSFGGVDNCATPCEGTYFKENERKMVAPAFILVAAIICVLFTLFTVATFLIDRHRFHYPERPIIYLSFCYLVISISYIVGAISRVIGDNNDSFACSDNQILDEFPTGKSYVFQNLPNSDTTYKSASCVILFVLVYFFQMASAIWWVILTLTWFLAAALKWGEEAVERLWLLYHVIAWSIPAIQVILVLALRLVDGDQLAGLCYVGNTNSVGLGVFVFLPLTIYLVLGIVFLVIGFAALVNISREVQNDRQKSRKIGRLIMRIGIYSLLYTIPNVILLILYVYQLAKSQDWEESHIRCPKNSDNPSPFCEVASYPSFAGFLIRYIMLFTIGICSTSWVLSSKTFAAWHRFFCSCGCNPGPSVTAIPNATYILPPDKKHGDLSMPSMHPQTSV
ncbi:frizzled-2-like [Halichondria panicea]|uniref:frizzled-2-like n=1 Tax=Halichondria panicea TaxID=6063 RepID=UPI00312B9E4F